MEVKETINNLISKKDCKYFIHRTAICTPWVDMNNGKLYTENEYENLMKTNRDYVEQNLESTLNHKDYFKKGILDYGLGWRISEQEYIDIYNKNFHEQIQNWFKKGVFVLETSIDRTATSLDSANSGKIENSKTRLYDLLAKVGFGMNTSQGNAMLGALSNRECLDTVLILEIPDICFGNLGEICPLFQESEEKLQIATAYRGVQDLHMVIPREYIKCAFHVHDNGIEYADNSYYKEDFILESGIHDNQTLKKILEGLNKAEQIKASTIEELLKIINEDFDIDKDANKLKSRISSIYQLLSKIEDISLRQDFILVLEELTDKTKESLERDYDQLLDINFFELNADEIIHLINNFITNGSKVLNDALGIAEKVGNYSKFNKMLEIYKNGLQVLNQDALKQLSSDNYMASLVSEKLKDINDLDICIKEFAPLDEAEILGELQESDREEYKRLSEAMRKAQKQVCIAPRENNHKYYLFSEDDVKNATETTDVEKKDAARIRMVRDRSNNKEEQQHYNQ